MTQSKKLDKVDDKEQKTQQSWWHKAKNSTKLMTQSKKPEESAQDKINPHPQNFSGISKLFIALLTSSPLLQPPKGS